jgi:hypothetical protein
MRAMNLQEIEDRVAQVDLAEGPEFIYSLLLAYGLPKAGIARLRSGTYNRSSVPGETLWKGRVFDRYDANGADLHAAIDTVGADERVQRERPRFVIVRDAARLLALDTVTRDTLDIGLSELHSNAAFFLPWAGIEKQQMENLHYADVKAAERMARLYTEIVKANAIETQEDIEALNIFFARLLFCFFAEDTDVFPDGSFTGAIASLTNSSGEDTAGFLDALFRVLDIPEVEREGVPAHFLGFGYVNGKLFSVPAPAPRFTAKARGITLDAGTLNWSQINPDIFGSMMQAVIHPGERQAAGMHYTSVENILKVIRPLFLDALEDELDKAETVSKLRRFITRIANVRVFDPACGSGNFLVIAYKELRRLEHRALRRIADLDRSSAVLFTTSEIQLESFYGIEIDGFAQEIAMLSLWLAKHQMNVEFRELFGAEIPLIPLRDAGRIVCGNAITLDWNEVCPNEGDDLYVVGNPPYAGSNLQTAEQKADFAAFYGTRAVSKERRLHRAVVPQGQLVHLRWSGRACLRDHELALPRRARIARLARNSWPGRRDRLRTPVVSVDESGERRRGSYVRDRRFVQVASQPADVVCGRPRPGCLEYQPLPTRHPSQHDRLRRETIPRQSAVVDLWEHAERCRSPDPQCRRAQRDTRCVSCCVAFHSTVRWC